MLGRDLLVLPDKVMREKCCKGSPGRNGLVQAEVDKIRKVPGEESVGKSGRRVVDNLRNFGLNLSLIHI